MEKGREFLGDLRDGVSESSLKIDVSELSKELSDTDDFGKRGELFVVGQVALGLLVVAPIVDLEPLARILGFGAMNLALAIIWAGVGSLGESLTPLPQPRKKAELTTDGMFKYMRHPLYTGLILGSFGLAIFTSSMSRGVFAVALTVLLYFKAVFEEEQLINKFGRQYLRYREKVKRFGIF
eukprot:CAMPEP_0170166934 /NCGR_PEP_ID=MMETSP0040_2-20121228/473_1 /TAXON_ID=641309 /ORGANISM="Lotharella oceanica, Strain CCMP622" /LENGTH=180 /DNA_ID=CAMNT_0010404793 /DNA_START=215 /DNA_END=757 /DNA_ORIENTATION=-